MKMTCPQCGYHGEFKKGRVPFFVFSLIDAHFASKRASKTFVCPECGCEVCRKDIPVEMSSWSVVLYLIIGFLAIGTLVVLVLLRDSGL